MCLRQRCRATSRQRIRVSDIRQSGRRWLEWVTIRRSILDSPVLENGSMALLCKGTQILVDPDGTCRRVEDLQVGDKVFDPLAQKLVEVANIIPWFAGQDTSTAPILIPGTPCQKRNLVKIFLRLKRWNYSLRQSPRGKPFQLLGAFWSGTLSMTEIFGSLSN